MVLLDVNVLVYAHREDSPGHPAYRRWLEETLASPEPFGIPDLVGSGFLRIVTHPQIFEPPTRQNVALAFLEVIRSRPNFRAVNPGERHWDIFLHLCKEAQAIGNRVPDAYLAAIAIENGSEWITTDRDYARFPGLRWRHPLGKKRK